MSKNMQTFKEKISENRGLSIAGKKKIDALEITISSDLKAVVYNSSVAQDELSEIVKDILLMRKNIVKGEKIRLTDIVDVAYDLEFLGVKNIEAGKKCILKIC